MISPTNATLFASFLFLSGCAHQPRPRCESNLQPINLPMTPVELPAPVLSEPPLARPPGDGAK